MHQVYATIANWLSALPAYWVNQIGGTFLKPGSTLSVAALACSLAVAIAMITQGRSRKRSIRPRVLVRALFPRRLVRAASARADIGYFLFSVLFSGFFISWAIISTNVIAVATTRGLAAALGTLAPTALPPWLCAGVATLLLFLAYEIAYWVDHYVSHKIAWLWEFHKVHHSAESLSLLTNFRVHPVDTIVFYNLVALALGVTQGALAFAFGRPTSAFTVDGTNILVMLTSVALAHIQHSHIWVDFGSRWGRVFLGPAHHQIHHSAAPAHFDKNFGNALAIWDRAFGTFFMPPKARQGLTLGLPDLPYAAHGWRAATIEPFRGAACALIASGARIVGAAKQPKPHAEISRAAIR